MNEEVIKIEDIVFALKKRWKLIVIITLSATLLSAIVSFFVIKPTYESSTKVFIGKEESESSEYNNSDIQMYQKLMKTYAELVKTRELVESALKYKKIDRSAGSVLSNLTVVPREDTQLLQIRYKSTNPEEVVLVTKAITNEFIKKSKELIPNGNVQVIEEARKPKSPISPNKKMNIAIAFLLGLMISFGLVFLLEYLDNSFKTAEDVERMLDLPVIGKIPTEEVKKVKAKRASKFKGRSKGRVAECQ